MFEVVESTSELIGRWQLDRLAPAGNYEDSLEIQITEINLNTTLVQLQTLVTELLNVTPSEVKIVHMNRRSDSTEQQTEAQPTPTSGQNLPLTTDSAFPISGELFEFSQKKILKLKLSTVPNMDMDLIKVRILAQLNKIAETHRVGPMRISVSKTFRAVIEKPQFHVKIGNGNSEFSAMDVTDYAQKLKSYLSIKQESYSCPMLFGGEMKDFFTQISSVCVFPEQRPLLDPPTLLVCSSNSIALVNESDAEVRRLVEPTDSGKASIGIRNCQVFQEKVAVFRVDAPPVIYALDSKLRLNIFFRASNCKHYGRIFSNTWNCTGRSVRVLGNKMYFLCYTEDDVRAKPEAKYPEIKPRVGYIWVNEKGDYFEEVGLINSVEDFLLESYDIGSMVLLKSDGEVVRVTKEWQPIVDQKCSLGNINGVSMWSALSRFNDGFVAAGYVNSKDRPAVFYYLLDYGIRLTGGTSLEVPLRRHNNLVPPVVSMITIACKSKPTANPSLSVELMLAILASGEIHVLCSKERLFLLTKITSNESTNLCAVTLCQGPNEEIYTGGLFYLQKLALSF